MLTPESRKRAKEARRVKPTRKEKMLAFASTFAAQRAEFPRMALPIIQRAEKGSLPDAIKLKCLDCSRFERKEVRDCVIRCLSLVSTPAVPASQGKEPE